MEHSSGIQVVKLPSYISIDRNTTKFRIEIKCKAQTQAPKERFGLKLSFSSGTARSAQYEKSIHHSGNIVCIIVSFNSSLSHRTHPEWISPIKGSPLHTAVIRISPPSVAEFNSTRLSSNRSGEIQRWLNQTCVWHLTADKGIIRLMQLEK